MAREARGVHCAGSWIRWPKRSRCGRSGLRRRFSSSSELCQRRLEATGLVASFCGRVWGWPGTTEARVGDDRTRTSRHVFGVVLEEADEAELWLDIIDEKGLGEPAARRWLLDESRQLRAIFSKGCVTARAREKGRRL